MIPMDRNSRLTIAAGSAPRKDTFAQILPLRGEPAAAAGVLSGGPSSAGCFCYAMRRWQFSLAQLLAGLAAMQVLCAASAGAFGMLLQFLTLASLFLAAAALLHLLLEGVVEFAVESLAALAAAVPLEVRPPAAGLLRRP